MQILLRREAAAKDSLCKIGRLIILAKSFEKYAKEFVF